MNYKISAIIPVYNVDNYISECLDSIINQTLEEIEIICINDGSSDLSKKLIEKFQKEDKRIILISKTNEGYGSACNTGLRLARGEYISIIEPDDYINKKMFKDLYTLASKNDADIVKSSYFEYRDDTNTACKINWSKEYKMPSGIFKINDCTQLVYFHPSIWSCIYKKVFLDKNNIRFVEAKGAGWTDNPFQIQTLCLAKRILYTDNAYYYYRLTNPGSSSNIVNIKNPFDRSDEVHEFLSKNKINNKDFYAHLYKREMSYIDTILEGVTSKLFDFACEKIKQMTKRMDKEILYKNKHINDYERFVYESCQSKNGILKLMKKIKEQKKNRVTVNI